MSSWPSFVSWQFALAGLVSAGIAVAIHIFNRRRRRVVHWAAMDLLQQAQRRQRRRLRWRDLLLLLVRVAAVLFFALALAEPYWSAAGRPLETTQPIHAVLLLDNSLSMAYETPAGTLLDLAKQHGRRLVEALPRRSQICVLPVCGARHPRPPEATRSAERALEFLDEVQIVDRAATVGQIVQAATIGSQSAGELTIRVVLLTDRQRTTWADFDEGIANAESLLQVVDVSPEETENCWIAEARIQDGIADIQTPTAIVIRVKQRSPRTRVVQVSLSVDRQVVASKPVTLNGDDEQDVILAHTFSIQQAGRLLEFASATAAISSDLLAEDDERHVMVPVMAGLPAVFVDQYGDQETPLSGRIGETRALRSLLAPLAGAASRLPHLRMEQLTQAVLAEARLVVIAGVAEPGGRVSILRQFVEQGGQLLIAAGADFDPRAWSRSAWLDGQGILPAPLEPSALGDLPETAERLEPFAISYDSITGNVYFQLAELSEADQRALYGQAFFFKAVQLDLAAASKPTKGARPAAESTRWLRWDSPTAEPKLDPSPRVLARFSNRQATPFIVEQRIGRGRVLFVSTGVQSSWNTLPRTNAVLVFDRILRQMLYDTLPRRNFDVRERIVVPLAAGLSSPQVSLRRPDSPRTLERLDFGFVRHDQRGVAIPRPYQRGVYRLLVGSGDQSAAAEDPGQITELPVTELPVTELPVTELPVTELPVNELPVNELPVNELAVNGDPQESDLTPLSENELARFQEHGRVRWSTRDQDVDFSGAQVAGRDVWWWLVLVTFLALIAECGLVTEIR